MRENNHTIGYAAHSCVYNLGGVLTPVYGRKYNRRRALRRGIILQQISSFHPSQQLSKRIITRVDRLSQSAKG